MLKERLERTRRAAEAAIWRVKTVGRVGMQTGMTSVIRWPGVKLLARELPRGKANPSLSFKFLAANNPHGTALVDPRSLLEPGARDRSLSNYEVNEQMDRIGAALQKQGFRRGSAALVMLKNRIEFPIIQAALGRIGASAVSLAWRSTVPEMEYIAKNSGAKALFFDAEVAQTVLSARESLAALVPMENWISVGGSVEGTKTYSEFVDEGKGHLAQEGDDGAVVMYTSGTTGKPKGAVRRFERSALAFALAFIGETPMRVGEVHLAVCPLYHATAFAFTGFTFLLGGTVVVLPQFAPELVLQAIERYRVTTTALVPTMIHRIVELGEATIRRYDTSSLKAIFAGGAPLGGQLAKEAMDVLGDKLYNFYGATETGLVTLASPADLRASPGTIGRAIPSNEIRLLDDRGNDVNEGEVGELYARSPALVDGYHGDAEATRQSMRDGYFSVGDLARRDARGCYFIEGRKRDMIISGGVNVYPAEVEAVLEAHPSIAEVAVVGVPDKEWGERVKAFVVLKKETEASADDLKAFCKERLASYKIPREFAFLGALPRNPTGKILKRELRAIP